ncbi:aminopeptidase M1 [Tanacetum coccineum]
MTTSSSTPHVFAPLLLLLMSKPILHGCDLLINICSFSSYEKVKEVEEFFASRAKPSIARTLKQSIERVQINAKWVETCQNEKSLADCLQELAYRKY